MIYTLRPAPCHSQSVSQPVSQLVRHSAGVDAHKHLRTTNECVLWNTERFCQPPSMYRSNPLENYEQTRAQPVRQAASQVHLPADKRCISAAAGEARPRGDHFWIFIPVGGTSLTRTLLQIMYNIAAAQHTMRREKIAENRLIRRAHLPRQCICLNQPAQFTLLWIFR